MTNVKFFVNGLNELINKIDMERVEYIGAFENLKLYDVSSCANNDDEFSNFCNDMYNFYFKDMLEYIGLEFNQYGWTSSHYFDIEKDSIFNHYFPLDYHGKTPKKKALMLIDELCNQLHSIDLKYNDNEFIGVNNYDIESINDDYSQDELTQIIDELHEEIINVLDAIGYGYKWIKDFKKNQLEHFRTWKQEQSY